MRTDQSRLRRPGIAAAVAVAGRRGCRRRRRASRARQENSTIYARREAARALLLDRRRGPCVRRGREPGGDASRPATPSRGTSAPVCTTPRRRPDAGERGVDRAQVGRSSPTAPDWTFGKAGVYSTSARSTPAWRARSSSRATPVETPTPTAHADARRPDRPRRDADFDRHRAPGATADARRATLTTPRPARPRQGHAGAEPHGRQGQGGPAGAQAALLGVRAGDGDGHVARRGEAHGHVGRRCSRRRARARSRCAARACAKGHLHRRAARGRRDGQPATPGQDDAEGQAMSFRPPADAWSRRDFMRNGFGSLALLCTFAAPASLRGASRGHLRRAARAGASRRSRRSSATCRASRSSRRSPRAHGVDVYDVDIREGLAEILPGFETPIYGYDGRLPRARRSAPARAATAIVRQTQQAVVRHQRAPARRLRAGRARRPPDGRHPARRARSTTRTRTTRTPRSSGTTTTRTAARRGRSTTGSSATYLLHDEREERARAAAGRVRRPARARRPRVQQGRLVPLRRERRPRLPRRHDPRQRRGLAAHGACSGGSTGCASSTRPTRAPTSCGSATGARCCRSPATAGCSSGRSRARASRCTRPSGSRS